MPQEFSTTKDLKAKQDAARERGEILPQDDVTVYATDKLIATHKVGQEIVVHSAIAKKLIESEKATEKAPTKAADKK